MLRREHASPEKYGVKVPITGGWPTIPVRVSVVFGAPRVVRAARRLNSPSGRALAEARAKVAVTVNVAPAPTDPDDGTNVKKPDDSASDHMTAVELLLVNFNEARTPRAKLRTFVDVTNGLVLRAVVVGAGLIVVVTTRGGETAAIDVSDSGTSVPGVVVGVVVGVGVVFGVVVRLESTIEDVATESSVGVDVSTTIGSADNTSPYSLPDSLLCWIKTRPAMSKRTAAVEAITATACREMRTRRGKPSLRLSLMWCERCDPREPLLA
jgi:hypothetical protein